VRNGRRVQLSRGGPPLGRGAFGCGRGNGLVAWCGVCRLMAAPAVPPWPRWKRWRGCIQRAVSGIVRWRSWLPPAGWSPPV